MEWSYGLEMHNEASLPSGLNSERAMYLRT